ncbi:MAG: hypothetical protein KBC84_08820, partial [Proteobacteria bacterium]|nr:hypothetical protein [Pseudomonadota bacterium]
MKKRIAWFCAHSSSDLLKSQQIFTSIYPKVSAEYEIDLFLDNYDLDEISSGKVTTASINTFHYLQAIQRHKTLSYSCFFYQIEDHPRAQYIFRHSQLMPGITYFHDLNLNQIYLDRFKDSTAGTDLNQEMDELFGKQSARLGNYKVRGWNNNIFDGIYQRGFEQLEKSAVTLVENTAQHEIIEKKIEDYKIEDCQILKPYFSLDSSIERNYNKAELKKELGLRSSDRILTYSLSSNYSNHLSTLLDLATTSEFQKLGITLLIIT